MEGFQESAEARHAKPCATCERLFTDLGKHKLAKACKERPQTWLEVVLGKFWAERGIK